MVNKVRVTIAGAPYAIATTDTESYITSLAKKLDEDITKLLDDNGNLSLSKAAVFCAMDYLDEYRKSAGSAENRIRSGPKTRCFSGKMLPCGSSWQSCRPK